MAILTVGPGQTYTTLASALAAAADGDTIVLQAGTYQENVTITQNNLTITGDPAAPGGAAGIVVEGILDVNGSDLSLQGFTVQTSSSSSGPNDNLIDARGGTGLSLDGMIVTVSTNAAGELMRGVWSNGDLSITDTVMTRTGTLGDTGAGRELVRAESTDNVTITGSDISGSNIRVFTSDMGTLPAPQITITDNTLDPLADGDAVQIYGPGWGALPSTFQPIDTTITLSNNTIPDGSGYSVQGTDGDDDMSSLASSGNDSFDGQGGNDTLDGGDGDDTLTGGTGDDVFRVSSGADRITDFDLLDTDGDGFTNDQLDVSALTNASGQPLTAADVVVSDDGSGNALLSFPNGESVVLQGISPAQVSDISALNAMGIPCFTAGTAILTPDGERCIDDLREGDLVTTRDNGAQPIRWIGSHRIGPGDLRRRPEHRPVLIQPGAFGNDRALLVSPLHGLLCNDPAAPGAERLVRAAHLVDMPGSRVRIAAGKRSVTYYHLLFDRHEIVFSNGIASESFYPGTWGFCTLSPLARIELLARFPELAGDEAQDSFGATARPFLRASELRRASCRELFGAVLS